MPRRTLKKTTHNYLPESSDQAVIYYRVSSSHQEKDGFSLPAQRKLLRAYAHSSGLKVVAEFVDVETAKTSGRTEFGQMVKYIRNHPSVKHLLVEKVDRL